MKKRLVKAIGFMMSAVLVLGCTACGNSEGNAAAGNGEVHFLMAICLKFSCN